MEGKGPKGGRKNGRKVDVIIVIICNICTVQFQFQFSML